MGRAVFKQEDGRYAIWSTIVDDYIVVDATRDEIVGEYRRVARVDADHISADALKIADGEEPKPHLYPEPEFPPEKAGLDR